MSITNGKARHVRRSPAWTRVSNIEYIEGATLRRISVRNRASKHQFDAVVLNVSEKQRATQCDSCRHKHRPTNKNCSATLGIRSHASTPGVLYDRHTGKSLGVWAVSDENFIRSATVGTCTYTKV